MPKRVGCERILIDGAKVFKVLMAHGKTNILKKKLFSVVRD
jgi:hypothetical protein